MALRVFQEIDGWVSGGLFAGTSVPMIASWLGVIFLLFRVDGLWQTRFTVGVEYAISLYAGLYKGVVKGFIHFIVSVGLIIFVIGMAGMVPGVTSWVEHLVLPVMLAFGSWVGIVIFGVCGGWRWFFAKFFPRDGPYLLCVMVSQIEIIRFFARPVILCVRLMVNVILGTVIVYTLRSITVCYGGVLLFMLVMAFTCYEIAVCFFQRYVFCMLLCIYMAEVE